MLASSARDLASTIISICWEDVDADLSRSGSQANTAYDAYHDMWHTQWGNLYIFGHKLHAPVMAKYQCNATGTCGLESLFPRNQ